MFEIFSKFTLYCFVTTLLYLGGNHVKFCLVDANKVDLNQIEVNDKLDLESGKVVKINKHDDNINKLPSYSNNLAHDPPYNSPLSSENEILKSDNDSHDIKIGNRQFYIDSNGNTSSVIHSLETNSSSDRIMNNSSYSRTEYIQNDRVNSEHLDSQHGIKPHNVTNTVKDQNNYNYSDINDSKITYDNLQAIDNSFDVFAVDFSIIYDDLMFDPNLKSNVEYTIFNTTNIETNNKIKKELKTTNGGHFVINLEDFSSYGFVTWIKPIESNSTEILLQSISGIMSNEKIRMLKKLFPRRNFTNDELDIFILSELRNEIRPYGYRGSPLILTQFIDNIDLNYENEDIFSFRETIENLNKTSYFKGSNDNYTHDSSSENNTFKFWNNSFLLHDDPELLSINCNYYNEWSSWSTCTSECGWGIQTRARRINANLIGKSTLLSDFELKRILRKCKIQIQTQGCASKIGCCEYQLPKENLWKNCTASCDNFGTEEQTVELVSNKKGKVKDSSCDNKKTLKRKCVRISGDLCKSCETTDWSKWSDCINENGDFIQKRTRELTDKNCNYGQTKLEENRICEKIPLFSTSPTGNNDGTTKSEQFLVSPEDSSSKLTINEIKECNLYKSEMKYNIFESACECPNGISLCDNTVIENNKTSWETHLDEICNKEIDTFSSKNIIIMAKGKRLYNCKTKSWDRYVTTPNDSDCKNAFVLCKVDSKCIVSDWSDWSGCSAPCKSSNTSANIPPFLSTKFKTRKVISGECNEHSLFKKEECLDLNECPQTKYVLSINSTSSEFIDLIYTEDIKNHIKKTFTELQSRKVPDNSTSNVMKNLFNAIRDIIIRNSEYIYDINFNFNVFGGDGNYHSQKFINFILSKYKFDNKELVKSIIVWVLLPSGEDEKELYEKLSVNDKQIIGANKDGTEKFLRGIIPYNQLSARSQIKEIYPSKLVEFATKNLSISTYNHSNISNQHIPQISEYRKYIPINDTNSLNSYKNESLNSVNTEFHPQVNRHESISNNTASQEESCVISKLINSEILYQLIQIAIIKNTNCKPFEIDNKNVNKINTKTRCLCPLGYTLCSSIDYYFGNHIVSTNIGTKIEIRNPEGIFSDGFVLNQGGLFEQVYEEDKEKYCSKPGAKVMCSSNSELLNAIHSYEIKYLYSRFVRFQSNEESS